MAGATVIGTLVERDADGFLVDPHAWTEELAVELARENGITTLGDQHWHVIHLMRDAYLTDGWSPSIRMLINTSGLSIDDLCRLFPHGPAKVAAKVAGIPKPRGCV